MYGRGKKLSKPKTQKNPEKNIINIIRNLSILKTELIIKNIIIRAITTLFEPEDDGYYKQKRLNNFWSNNYIKYESNGDRNKNLSLEEYCNKVKPYLKDIIIDLQTSDTWKIQATIAINFVSSKDAEEDHVIHSKSKNINFTSYNDSNEVVDELFKSLRSRYQHNLEKSI